jgi:hypothetical protein
MFRSRVFFVMWNLCLVVLLSSGSFVPGRDIGALRVEFLECDREYLSPSDRAFKKY